MTASTHSDGAAGCPLGSELSGSQEGQVMAESASAVTRFMWRPETLGRKLVELWQLICDLVPRRLRRRVYVHYRTHARVIIQCTGWNRHVSSTVLKNG